MPSRPQRVRPGKSSSALSGAASLDRTDRDVGKAGVAPRTRHPPTTSLGAAIVRPRFRLYSRPVETFLRVALAALHTGDISGVMAVKPSFRTIIVTGAVLTAIAAGAWRFRGSHEKAAAPQPQPPSVSVATIATGAFPVRLESIASVQPLNTVSVRARVDGQIEQAFFKQGEIVKQGDLLVRLDARPFKAALDQAQAKRTQDQATLDNSKRDLERYSQLAAKSFATEQQLNTQQATVASGTAQIAADDAAVENAQTQLSYTEIRAPISGRIGFRQVDVGNIVHAGDAQPILSIVQVDPVFVMFSIPEDRIFDVQQAMREGALKVDVYTSDRATLLAQGELTVLNNQVDQTTGTLQAKATFDNKQMRLWPGQSVIAVLHVRDIPNVLLAPYAAVQRGPDGLYVWLVENDKATIRKVESERQGEGNYVIKGGVKAGDRVVVAGQTRLYDGAKVAISAQPAAPAERRAQAQ